VLEASVKLLRIIRVSGRVRGSYVSGPLMNIVIYEYILFFLRIFATSSDTSEV
jgi:hypothetical protein